MTVAQLIEALRGLPPEAVVLYESDEGYALVAGVNLPLLIKALSNRRGPIDELAATLVQAGQGAIRLLSDLGTNTFKGFGPNKAKQYAPVNHEGYVIGDVILFGLEDGRFNLVGRPSVHNWVRYNAETGGYSVKCTVDDRAADQKGEIVRQAYRFQVQGPNAMKVVSTKLKYLSISVIQATPSGATATMKPKTDGKTTK